MLSGSYYSNFPRYISLNKTLLIFKYFEQVSLVKRGYLICAKYTPLRCTDNIIQMYFTKLQNALPS